MDPYAELNNFLLNIKYLTRKTPYSFYNVRTLKGEIFREWDQEEYISNEDITTILSLYDKCLERDAWKKQAEQQLFVADYKKELLALKPKTYDDKYVAVTLCPPPEYSDTHHHLFIFMDVIKSISAVKSIKYVFEQRSKDDEQEYGWHIHMSICTSYAPSKLHQFIRQKLESKKYKFMWKIALLCRPDDGGFKNKYILGEKTDSTKKPLMIKDKILRERYNIEHAFEYVK